MHTHTHTNTHTHSVFDRVSSRFLWGKISLYPQNIALAWAWLGKFVLLFMDLYTYCLEFSTNFDGTQVGTDDRRQWQLFVNMKRSSVAPLCFPMVGKVLWPSRTQVEYPAQLEPLGISLPLESKHCLLGCSSVVEHLLSPTESWIRSSIPKPNRPNQPTGSSGFSIYHVRDFSLKMF